MCSEALCFSGTLCHYACGEAEEARAQGENKADADREEETKECVASRDKQTLGSTGLAAPNPEVPKVTPAPTLSQVCSQIPLLAQPFLSPSLPPFLPSFFSCQLPCYLCEAARGGTLGGLSRGMVGMLSTCRGPGLRLLVTSGTSLSYSKKGETEG